MGQETPDAAPTKWRDAINILNGQEDSRTKVHKTLLLLISISDVFITLADLMPAEANDANE